MPYPNPISLPQDQSPGSPSQINDAIRHINYGNTLAPVDLNGEGVDNAIGLGSSNKRFSGVYTNGIASGEIGAPLWKWTRITLGPRNIVDGLVSGTTLMWTVNLPSSIGTSFSGLMYSMTLISDTGLSVGSCEKLQHYSINNAVMECFYNAFSILPVSQTLPNIYQLNIYQQLLFGGIYDSYSSFFQNNTPIWRGTTNNRGYLDVFYTTT